jgi:hypothetical protein
LSNALQGKRSTNTSRGEHLSIFFFGDDMFIIRSGQAGGYGAVTLHSVWKKPNKPGAAGGYGAVTLHYREETK